MRVDIDPHVQHNYMIFTYTVITFLIFLKLAYCKPRDPIGSNNRCTVYDTMFYKPEDDPMGSKNVAVLNVALF